MAQNLKISLIPRAKIIPNEINVFLVFRNQLEEIKDLLPPSYPYFDGENYQRAFAILGVPKRQTKQCFLGNEAPRGV